MASTKQGRPRRIKNEDPVTVEKFAALGRRSSPAKSEAALRNGTGNKSKTGQTDSAETRAKKSAAWVTRRENAAKKEAAEQAQEQAQE